MLLLTTSGTGTLTAPTVSGGMTMHELSEEYGEEWACKVVEDKRRNEDHWKVLYLGVKINGEKYYAEEYI